VKRLIWSFYALFGGALWGLCFAAEGFLWAPWVALAPLMLLLARRDAVRLGFLFGFASWLTALPWIAPTLVTFGGLSPWLAWPLLALLTAYLALFVATFAWLAAPVWRRAEPWLALLGLPAVWVFLEWVRGWLLSGFPWNLAGYAFIETRGALESSGWIGAYGVSFLLVLANTGIALAIARRRWQLAAWGPLVALTIFAAADRRQAQVEPEPALAPPVRARVLQPNIPNLLEWDARQVGTNYSRLITMSHRACDGPGTLVVWPESAAWPYELGRDATLARDLEALNEKGCTILLNSVRRDGEAVYNAAFLVGPLGTEWYAKRRLVPFGEFVPGGDLLPFVGTLARHAGRFTAGTEARLLPFGDQLLGAAICYEVVFPGAVAATVRDGATLLVSVTNDDWYGPTAAPWQHLRAARFRAAESRRSMLRAAITGVSAIVGPDGGLVSTAGLGEERILSAELVGRRDVSPYSRYGFLMPWVTFSIGGFAIFWTRRSRGKSGSA
jgi:apolipoprotein N-acyltransferase